MSEIAVPDYDALDIDALRLSQPAQVNRSAWTGTRQVVGLPGAELWLGRISVGIIGTESEERAWRAFLFGLAGPINWFKLKLPCQTHSGAMPTVGAGAGSGYSLPLTGMSPSTAILEAGQFITVTLPSGYPRTVCLTADLASDGSGNAVAQFRPALGEIPAEGAAVETKAPFIRMALADDDQGFAMQNGVSGLACDIEEAR